MERNATSAPLLAKLGHPDITSAIPPYKTIKGGRLSGFTT